MRSLASPLFKLSQSFFWLSCLCGTLVGSTYTQADSLIPDSALASPAPHSLIDNNLKQEQNHKNTTADIKAVVIYFSQPEQHSLEDSDLAKESDILTGASLIFNRHRDQIQGNIEYMAQLIADSTDADLVSIESQQAYPRDHNELIQQSVQEFDLKSRPQISLNPQIDLAQYDTIFLGYPVWWNDLPMPIYSFLDQYDLSNKRVLLFCSYDKSNPFNTFKIVSQLEPNAQFVKNLSIERTKLFKKGQQRIQNWLEDLNFEKSSDTTFHLNKNASPVILLKE